MKVFLILGYVAMSGWAVFPTVIPMESFQKCEQQATLAKEQGQELALCVNDWPIYTDEKTQEKYGRKQ